MEKDISRIHVVSFINNKPTDGEVVDEWGAHVTIVKPFELPGGRCIGDIVSAVGAVAGEHKPLLLQPIGHELNGPDETEDSIKILRTPELHRVHLDLVRVFEGLGITFPDARWMRESYNPHSTVIGGLEMTGPTVCDSLSVNMKRLGQRVVAKTVRLGNVAL